MDLEEIYQWFLAGRIKKKKRQNLSLSHSIKPGPGNNF